MRMLDQLPQTFSLSVKSLLASAGADVEGGSFGQTISESLASFVSGLVQRAIGAGAGIRLYANISWADLFAALFLLALVVLVSGLLGRMMRRRLASDRAKLGENEWRVLVIEALSRPLYVLVWIYGIYFACGPLLINLPAPAQEHPVRLFADKVFDFGIFVVLFWFFYRCIHIFDVRLRLWAAGTESVLDDLLAPLLVKSLRVVVPVIAIIFALPIIGLSEQYETVVSKGSSLLIIGAVAWILCQTVLVSEKVVLSRYDITAADNLRARRIYTQVHVLKKTLIFVIGIFTVASVLMMFEEVRRLGTSILASAGVVGIIIGFAAQRTISNLFAGLQLALTQPIRIDDVVIVENEWGRIEEVTLTYVVVRIWDMRRLIVPIGYFIERPFQNWTRTSADILGSVAIYVDYTIPIEAIRKELLRIVENSKDWDKKFCNIQVINATERAIEVRALATAADASKAWDLRCEIREQLIVFVQKNYPDSLPKIRATVQWPDNKMPSQAQLS